MEAGGRREAWRLAGVYLSTWALGPGGGKSGLNPFCLEYRARPPRRASKSTGDKIGFRDMFVWISRNAEVDFCGSWRLGGVGKL